MQVHLKLRLLLIGRNTQGVRVIKLKEDEALYGLALAIDS